MSLHVRYTPTPHVADPAVAKSFGFASKLLESPYVACYDGRNLIDCPLLQSKRYLDMMATDEYAAFYPVKSTALSSRAKSAMVKSFRNAASASNAVGITSSAADLNASAAAAATADGQKRIPRRPSQAAPPAAAGAADGAGGAASFRRSSTLAAGGRRRSVRFNPSASLGASTMLAATAGGGVVTSQRSAVERAQASAEERALQMFMRVAPAQVPRVSDRGRAEALGEAPAIEMRRHATYVTPAVSRVVDAGAAKAFAEAVLREESASSQAASLVAGKGAGKDGKDGAGIGKKAAKGKDGSSAASPSSTLRASAAPSPNAAAGNSSKEDGLNASVSMTAGHHTKSEAEENADADSAVLQYSIEHFSNDKHRRKHTALTALIPATEAQQQAQAQEDFARRVVRLPVAGTLRDTDENIAAEICAHAARALTLRQSVTVVNTGMCRTGKSEFGVMLLDKLIECAGSAIERALETHADELARQREDALLLANAAAAQAAEGAANNKNKKPTSATSATANINEQGDGGDDEDAARQRGGKSFAADRGVPALGRSIQKGMGQLGAFLRSRSPQSARTGSAGFRSARVVDDQPQSSRFVLYVPAVPRPLPSVKLESHLVPSSDVLSTLGIATPRSIPSGRAASDFWLGLSEEEAAAARRDELEAQAALQRAAQRYTFGRKSSLKLRQTLGDAVDIDRMFLLGQAASNGLEGNGRGHEQWGVMHWNGETSVLELPPVPTLERGIKAFVIDLWLYRPPQPHPRARALDEADVNGTAHHARDGDGNVRVPEVLLQIAETTGDKGMLLRVGLNTELPGSCATLNCEVLQLLVRDSAGRTLEVLVALTDYMILTRGDFHHILIKVSSLEESTADIRVNGHGGREQYIPGQPPSVFSPWLQQRVTVGGNRDAVGAVEHGFFGSICELRMWRHPEGPSRFDTHYESAMNEFRKAQRNRALEDDHGSSPYTLMQHAAQQKIITASGKVVQPPRPPSLAPLLKLNVDKPVRAEFAPAWSWPLEPIVTVDAEAYDPDANLSMAAGGTGGEHAVSAPQIELLPGATMEHNDDFRPESPPAGSPKTGAAAASAAAAAAAAAASQQPQQLPEGVVARPTITRLQATAYDAPRTCPLFDGQSLVVNMSPLGPLGDYLHSFIIEVRFRCSNTKRPMSLLGVTDTQVRKQELGIVINAEPNMTLQHGGLGGGGGGTERFRFHANSITVYLVDATGRCLSAVMRGTERTSLIDGKWHTLVWRVLDAESNKLEIKVDGQPQEAAIAVRESPKNFVAFRQWLCLGGHNVRDFKVRNLFEGCINRVAISVRGESLVEYRLNEGNGATIAIDETGHKFHGTYFDPQFMQQHGKHSIMWVPQRDDGDKKKGDGDDDDDAANEHVMHCRNDVRFAVLCVTVSTDAQAGRTVERVYDLLRDTTLMEKAGMQNEEGGGGGRDGHHQQQHSRFGGFGQSQFGGGGGEQQQLLPGGANAAPPVELKYDPKCGAPYFEPQWGPTSMRCYTDDGFGGNSGSGGSGGGGEHARGRTQVPHRLVNAEFLRLPDGAFRDAETTKQVRREVSRVMRAHAAAVKRGTAGALDGHILVVVAVGDARLAYVDLRGPFWPAHSQYDLNMKRWTMPMSSAHGEARRAMLLNLMSLSVEKALLAATRNPSLARRTSAFTKARDLVRHLESHALPSLIGGLLHWLLLDVEFASHVHLVQSMWKLHTEDDAAAFATFQRVLADATKVPAAIMIAKVARGWRARRAARNMALLREIRRTKVEEIAALRKALPAVVLPKKNMVALVILNLRSGQLQAARRSAPGAAAAAASGGGEGGSGSSSSGGGSASAHLHAKNAPALTPKAFDCMHEGSWLPPLDHVGPQSVIAALEAQGYQVQQLVDAPRDVILERVRALSADNMNFVYMCGYGTNCLHYPVSHVYEGLYLEQKEDYLRTCIDWDFCQALKAMKKQCAAIMQDLVEKREAALAAKKKKKGGAASVRAASSSTRGGGAAAAASSAAGAAAVPSRRGMSRAAVEAEMKAEAARLRTQIEQDMRDLEYNETQLRAAMSDTWANERRVLREEFEDLVASTRLFEDECIGRVLHGADAAERERELLPQLAYLPADTDSTMPFVEDVVFVSEIYELLFRRTIPLRGESFAADCPAVAAPDDACRGLQAFLAVDLLPAVDAVPRYHGTVDRAKVLAPLTPLPNFASCAVIAASTGHSQAFFHDCKQRMMLTWHLRKALSGHVERNYGERAHPARMLSGAVLEPPEPGMRDVPALFEYLSRKLSKRTLPAEQGRMRTVEQLLDSNLVYYADVLPVRRELSNEEARHALARQAETKRVQALALVAARPERGAGEIQNELQAHLGDLQTVEVIPLCSLLVTFLRQARPWVLRSVDGIDLDAVRLLVRKSMPRWALPQSAGDDGPRSAAASINNASASINSGAGGYVEYEVTASALGVRIDFSGLADKNKMLSVISTVALKLTTASFPARRTSSDIALYCDDGHEDARAGTGAAPQATYDVNDVEALYAARGVTNARRFKNVLKRWVHSPLIGTAARLLMAHGHSSVDNSDAGFAYS